MTLHFRSTLPSFPSPSPRRGWQRPEHCSQSFTPQITRQHVWVGTPGHRRARSGSLSPCSILLHEPYEVQRLCVRLPPGRSIAKARGISEDLDDKRLAEATPYPLPVGSRLLQDLGFLAFTLPHVDILMPTKKPRGQELTLEQELANQALHYRRLRIEHVNSSVKRCRIVKDRIRLWKQGVRDLVMELCRALHNFRVRLTPWQPMV